MDSKLFSLGFDPIFLIAGLAAVSLIALVISLIVNSPLKLLSNIIAEISL